MYIADLHIHSRYSRATSRDLTPETLDLWARRKGIGLVGTGDFTHLAWREELREKLEPAEEGLYVLKEAYRLKEPGTPDQEKPRFVVTGEISSIYKKNGKVRKVHSLILLPGLEEAEVIAGKLENIGNIHSDGRPILGLDCHDLLEIVLELCPEAIYVPAHIWTPHFSLFGACSGFDSLEECFEDLSGEIHAMETGLSADPPMIWRVSALDSYQLLSNSDAHSPAKLGREANLLDTELSYQGLWDAIQKGKGLLGTIEFFPEEGKYHFDGHRKCNLCLSPKEAEKYHGICPVCGRKLTMGVSHRIEQLSDRPEGYFRKAAKPFESLVPLSEVLAASTGHSAASVKVQRQYFEMISRLGSEFEILRNVPKEDIRKVAGSLAAEGIHRLRKGEVERIPGFDGEYGSIQLFHPWEIEELEGQMSFFTSLGITEKEKNSGKTPSGKQITDSPKPEEEENHRTEERCFPKEALNSRQKEAVTAIDRAVAVIAGPGTGKTKTLVARLEYMMKMRKIKPSEITAVTFTNQAAGEMRERLKKQLGAGRSASKVQIGTFHSICMNYLKGLGLNFYLADEIKTLDLAEQLIEEYGLSFSPKKFLQAVSDWKCSTMTENTCCSAQETAAFQAYKKKLKEENCFDFDDLLLETMERFGKEETLDKAFRYLLVDEFQDVSSVQFQLIQTWMEQGRELFVIGDPDQSIYGFRGSDAECFVHLSERVPELRIVRLENNYRSTPEIVESAVSVIRHNPGEERTLKSVKEKGSPLRLVKASGSAGEAIFAAKEINRLMGGIDMLDVGKFGETQGEKGRSFRDFAVLYRTRRQGEILEECFRREGIPYQIGGRDDFLTEKTIRGCLSFFRCLENPEDEWSGELAIKCLWNLEEQQISREIFTHLMEKYQPSYEKTRPVKLLKEWRKDLDLVNDPGLSKLSDLALPYRTMREFLQAVSFGVESDLSRVGGKSYAGDAVTLMTLHGSKGLEFPVVLLLGVNKGLIPLENGQNSAEEEERRLFYVGMTRAKEELILVTSKEESAFIRELPENLFIRESLEGQKKQEEIRQLSLFDFL